MFNTCNCNKVHTPLHETFFNFKFNNQITLSETSNPHVNINPVHIKSDKESIYLNTAHKIIKKRDIKEIVKQYNEKLHTNNYPIFGNFKEYDVKILPIMQYNHFSWNTSWKHINNNFHDIYPNINRFK